MYLLTPLDLFQEEFMIALPGHQLAKSKEWLQFCILLNEVIRTWEALLYMCLLTISL